MNLTELQHQFKTDKGTAHDYLKYYDLLFKEKQYENINFLEIGILFGESLKLFSTYFSNGKIYGIENFEQKDGHASHNFIPVNKNEVLENLTKYNNIIVFNFDCEDEKQIINNLDKLTFDIIIDDASHRLDQQLKNLNNYSKYLNLDGIYICEDISTQQNGEVLLDEAKKLYPAKKIELLELNINKKSDDRLLIIKN